MQYKDLADGEYFVSRVNPTQYYQKLNDTHAFPVPINTTLELGREMIHVDPECEDILSANYIPPTPPPEPKEVK